MGSRMDKYEFDTEKIPRRTERNKYLYESNEVDDYEKFDINSNVSVLKNNAREIDVDQIRDILDKKYRDNIPQRKSIDIPKYEEPTIPVDDEDTKEYDINNVLSKAKEDRVVDYDTMRLNKTAKTDELVDKINEKYGEDRHSKEEQELRELIDTITNLELKSQKQNADLLGLADDTTIIEEPKEEKTSTGIVPKKLEEEFYTGNLTVNDDDFDDFSDMQKDIKSNSIFIKVLVFIVILALIALGIYVLNNVLDLGLF